MNVCKCDMCGHEITENRTTLQFYSKNDSLPVLEQSVDRYYACYADSRRSISKPVKLGVEVTGTSVTFTAASDAADGYMHGLKLGKMVMRDMILEHLQGKGLLTNEIRSAMWDVDV